MPKQLRLTAAHILRLCFAAICLLTPLAQAQNAIPASTEPSNYRSPLFEAIYKRDVEGVRQALAGGHSAKMGEGTGKSSALFSAVNFGEPQIVRMLLEKGADPRYANEEGETVLNRTPGPVRLLLPTSFSGCR